jgi:adenylate cyclase
MAHVFISYARATAGLAEQVERALVARGFTVWRDNALSVHRAYADEIEEQIAQAAAVVVLWSTDAARSEWVRSEADRGRELVKLVQASLDHTLPPMPFNQMHCADLAGWNGGATPAWVKILESLAHLSGGQAVAPERLASNHALPPLRAAEEPFLAVMAFENLSGDPDFLYFSDGLSDEILHTVTQTTDLKVIARASSFQLRGGDKNPTNVARLLNATHMLDGSVRRSGQRIRISAQLVDCATQTTMWNDRFDRDLSDAFALQDEIAGAVAEALKVAFAPRDTGTVDPVAFDLYLRARQPSPTRLWHDVQLLEEAVDRAPTFLKGWETLAVTCATLAKYMGEGSQFVELTAKMNVAVDRALALDPNTSAAGLSRLMVLPLCGAFQETEHLMAEAIRAAPGDPLVLQLASAKASEVGRLTVALAYIAQAYEIDPLDPNTATWYAAMLASNRRGSEATALFDDFIERWPNEGFLRATAVGRALEMQDWARVERYAAAPGDIGIYAGGVQGLVAASHDMQDSTPELTATRVNDLRGILAASGTVFVSWLGSLASKGAVDEVYDLIEQASFASLFQPGGRMLPGEVSINPIFYPGAERMRQDPRFVRFCARLGLCDYWVATNRWPDCADELAHLYDFRALARAEVAPPPPTST